MRKRGACASFQAAVSAAMVCLVAAGRVHAGWRFDRVVAAEGRRLMYGSVIAWGGGWETPWALIPDGLVRYSGPDGIISVVRATDRQPYPLRQPAAAVWRNDRVYIADNGDRLIKVISSAGSIRVFGFGQAGTAVMATAIAPTTGGVAVAVYDFDARGAYVEVYTGRGVYLTTLRATATGPGPWDWIFALSQYGDDLLVYAYAGDGRAGRSWVEKRFLGGGFGGAALVRDEADTAPLMYASRSLYTRGADVWVLGPSDAGGLAIYAGRFGEGFAKLADGVEAVIAEPWCTISYAGADGVNVLARWPDGPRPGHVYRFDQTGALVSVAAGTRGPQAAVYHPSGVDVLSDGRLVVADTDNYRCLILRADYGQVAAVALDFRPGAVAVGPGDVVAAVNADQAETGEGPGVVFLSADGRVVGQAGPWGVGPGALAGPAAVDWAADGRLFVADTFNNRVVMLDGQGRQVGVFGGTGEAPPHMYRPYALAVAGDRVFVAMPDHPTSRVAVYDLQGNYLRHWWADGRVLALAAAGDGQVVAALEGYGVVVYNALGDALDGLPWDVYVGYRPSRPAAVAVTDGALVVADTGNSRLLRFVGQPPEPSVKAVQPTVVPVGAPRVEVVVAGEALPSDLTATLQRGATAVACEVSRQGPTLARLRFSTQDAAAGHYTLRLSGTGLEAAADVFVTGYVDPVVTGRWRVESGGQTTLVTVSLTGEVRWEQADSGRWRAGRLAMAGDVLTMAFFDGAPAAWVTTETYRWRQSGSGLALDGLFPGPTAGVSLELARAGAAAVLDPALSGVWELAGLEVDGAVVDVTWTERMAVDAAGGYVNNSSAEGLWRMETGRIEAAAGDYARGAITGGRDQALWRGTYELAGDQLTVLLDEPPGRRELWRRVRVAGHRPLPWLGLDVPASVFVGRKVIGRVVVTNHGDAAATGLVVELRASWLQGPVTVAGPLTLAAGASITRSFELPAPTAPGSAVVRATVRSGPPDALSWHVSRSVAVRAPAMDLTLTADIPTAVLAGDRTTVALTVTSSGVPPAQALPAEALDEPALIVSCSPGASFIGGGGTWNSSARRWQITWRKLLELAGESDRLVARPQIYIAPELGPGAIVYGTAQVRVPGGVREVSPADNATSWQATVTDRREVLTVGLQPAAALRPGMAVTVVVAAFNSSDVDVNYDAVAIELPPLVDPSSAAGAEGWTFDASRRLLISGSGRLPRLRVTRFVVHLRVAPWAEAGDEGVFRATVFLQGQQPVTAASAPVQVGWPVGDIDRDGSVALDDLVAFIRGFRAARTGQYQPACDIAPLVGQWPTWRSAPDGAVDHLDAAAMLDATLSNIPGL